MSEGAMPFLSTGFQAATSMFDAMGQSASYKAAAAVDQENARLDLLQGAINSEDIRRRGRAVQGEAISALAAGGGDVSGLSSRDLIFQNSLNIELAAMNARYGAASAARGDLYKAAQDKSAARAAIIGGVMRAGAAAINGYSQYQSYQDRYAALFPGGQRLPMSAPPTSASAPPPPIYTPTGVVGPR